MMKSFNVSNALLFLLLLTGFGTLQAQSQDPFLKEKYRELHNSPEQEKYRKIAPMPAGVVYIQWPGDGEAEIREHFRTMKKLGYNALKQIMTVPGWTDQQIELIALEEGLVPWWYGEGGWEPITDDLLKKLKIPLSTPISEIRAHPKMIEYQTGVLRQRVEKEIDLLKQNGELPRSSARAFEPSVGGRGVELSDKGKEEFIKWAKTIYQNIEQANFAYNQHHAGLQNNGRPYASWDDFHQRWEDANHREYRAKRDIFRFKADYSLASLEEKIALYKKTFPHAPFRAGGELGLFLPQAWYCVDLEGIADRVRNAGTFYPSIHFSWHYDQVDNELTLPFYMQSSYTNDIFKGGWSATWESSGGPQQFDGEKFGGDKGFTVDDKTMTQFVLSQIAAGLKGFGIWCWNARSAGKEGGEYSLLDRNNKVTPRAVKVGQIAQAMNRYRQELWDAQKEPLVGVLASWDNEAIWAAMSVNGKDEFRQRPISARVGVSRALINANVPFEYVTPDDLRNGLAGRYRILYLPSILAMNNDLMPILDEYVRNGGRLVMDLPGAWFDEYSALVNTAEGSAFEKIFGTELNDFHYSGHNRVWSLEGMTLDGFTARFTPTKATPIAYYDNGAPAITEHRYGKGAAIILGFEASDMCFQPGHTDAEEKLVRYALGDYESPYACQGAVVYRLPSPAADHYFLINTGPAQRVFLDTKALDYRTITDAITGEELPLGAAIEVEGYGGRWLRFGK